MASKRPSKKTPEIVDEIMESIADGVPLREICRREGMPNWRTVYDWLEADEELAARFARARDIGFDAIAEETLEIADDGTNDWTERKRQDGSTDTVLDSEHVQRSKLRIETRLKLLAKWSPKKYGDKQTVEVGNKDGEALKVESNADNAALALQLAEALRVAGIKDLDK
jgi:hypothetical protein